MLYIVKNLKYLMNKFSEKAQWPLSEALRPLIEPSQMITDFIQEVSPLELE